MPKKNCFFKKNATEVIGWKPPVFHQASESYVSVSAFDPAIGKMHIKKFMVGKIKGKRNQRLYAENLMRNITEKLLEGWNPWITVTQTLEYSEFEDVALKYKSYLFKMLKEQNMREETVTSYISRINILLEWKSTKKINLFYTYQFDKFIVGKFLDYVFIDRNNTMRTRNNYLSWLKSFAKYLLQRGYISTDPTETYNCVDRNKQLKNRDVIPDEVLQELHDYLDKKNKYYLLACYILHYVFVRPKEMSYLKVGDFSIKRQTLFLHGDQTKNHNDAVLTLPAHVLKLMIDLHIFDRPSQYYLFSTNFRPGDTYRSEKSFRDFWHNHIRKDLNLSTKYKFYSLKDTGITNMLRANTDILSVRDQARHSSILITDIYTPKDIKEANKLLMNYHGVL